ncbi:hypothetical protein PAXRUDRAFT_731235 [Paxillus rubicundulus Ve08.2h10]|uniref:Uncharacterized protein n=1 Tax=Paxillus rubicundulus Ve08.2h10 TaxID=930991 RepID=A0A0D0DCS7_9AGAM|nr:hypothetical protein PAXRUDRAFT_731235 [Paxillus rubicundulus Ve08.2h10]
MSLELSHFPNVDSTSGRKLTTHCTLLKLVNSFITAKRPCNAVIPDQMWRGWCCSRKKFCWCHELQSHCHKLKSGCCNHRQP